MSKQTQEQQEQVVADELSQQQLDRVAGGMINVRKAVASAVKGGALEGSTTRNGGDDDLDDLEVER